MNEYYKDELPENTVSTLLKILKDKGIYPTFSWLESIPGVHSVIVSIPGTTISSNGKGSTKALACASGLAELVERLQNFLCFRLSDAFSFSVPKIFNLMFPSIFPKGELSTQQKNSWFHNIENNKNQQLIQEIISSDYTKGNIYSRYTNYVDPNAELFVPYSVLDYYYGSNGMAAGNTWNEALVQALSEIIERHVAFQLLSEGNQRDDIFDITDAYLLYYPDFYSKIKKMKDNNFVIRILDFSIGGQFPVIGLLAINQHELSYFINLGCHPNINVAVQRALNEFLQGRKINEINDMQPFYTNFNQVKLTKNIGNVFHDGTGVFPISCLIPSARESCLPTIWLQNYSSNEDMLDFYLNLLCGNLNKEIFIQYQSVLDFPVVHVIIPNFSEVAPLMDIGSVRTLINVHEGKQAYLSFIKEYSLKLSVEPSVLIKLIDFFERLPTIPVAALFNLPISPVVNPLLEVSTAHILMCLYVLESNYKLAYSAALNHLNFLKNLCPNSSHIRYNIVVSILYLFANDYTNEQVAEYLVSIGYAQSMVQEYIRQLSSQSILELLPCILCPNCTDCEFSDLCCFDSECQILLQITQSK